jgi:hypothetical protein
MDVHAYLARKLVQRRKAELVHRHEKEVALREKKAAYEETYFVTLSVGARVDLKDKNTLLAPQLYRELGSQERLIYDFTHPKGHGSEVYIIQVGPKSVDIKDPRVFLTRDILDQLTPEEQDIYEATHSKTHFVLIGRKRVDLKDPKTTITRVEYDKLSRENKQVYLIAHPRDPAKSTSAMRLTPDLIEHLDQKYSENGVMGFKTIAGKSATIKMT